MADATLPAGDGPALTRVRRSGAGPHAAAIARGAELCAGSAICPPPGSMAIAAALGWTRTRRPRQLGRARRRRLRGRTGAGRPSPALRGRSLPPGRHLRTRPVAPSTILRAGTARRIVKPGHAFGRIHRDDIARAVLAAMRQDRAARARAFSTSPTTSRRRAPLWSTEAAPPARRRAAARDAVRRSRERA